MDIISLNELKRGKSAFIYKVGGRMKRRLLDLGLLRGTRVVCVGKSPLGGMSAYMVKGAVVAIREKDCKEVLVRLEA